MQFLASVTRMLVFVFAMLTGFFRAGGNRTGFGSRFERGSFGLLSCLGGLGLSSLLFDFLLRGLRFQQTLFISLLFGLDSSRFFLRYFYRLRFSLGCRFGLARLFFSLFL